MQKQFYLLVGIPGSGKSTYAKRLAEEIETTLICPDDIRAELCGDITDQSRNHYIFSVVVPERIRAAKGHIVYDATNYNVKNRRNILKLARSLDFETIVCVMTTSFQECLRRNAARQRVVPKHVMDRMIIGYEAPSMVIEQIDKIVFI
jgi:protein phosphatase